MLLYWTMKFFGWLMCVLPQFMRRLFADFIGFIAWKIVPKWRKYTAVQNVMDCLGVPEERAKVIAKKSVTRFGRMVVEREIRTLEVANGASRVSTIGFVRREFVRQQQRMGLEKGIVMDGRDIGTVVFPEAELKVFVTASADVRAQRRYDELVTKGQAEDFEAVLANVKERDERDTNRVESPLKQAHDALLIDNSLLTKTEQRDLLRKWFDEKTR